MEAFQMPTRTKRILRRIDRAFGSLVEYYTVSVGLAHYAHSLKSGCTCQVVGGLCKKVGPTGNSQRSHFSSCRTFLVFLRLQLVLLDAAQGAVSSSKWSQL
jgi:hypothetical protein